METSSMISYGLFTGGVFLFAVFVGFILQLVMNRQNTTPSGSMFKDGFQGAPLGVSTLPCGQESAEATAIVNLFEMKKSTTEEGDPDLTELIQILSKLCCMKHDLMSINKSVSSMLHIPYVNTHDRENPADTVGRCFTKSVPERDLNITFETWNTRAQHLIDRLCTSYNLSSQESDRVKNSFNALHMDVFIIAKGECLESKEMIKLGSPRDPKPFLTEDVKELGPYTGYY